MGSQAGLKKQCPCIKCGKVLTVSLYANANTVKCNDCKGTSTGNITPIPTPDPDIHVVSATVNHNGAIMANVSIDRKPTRVRLIRNRQEIEATVVMDGGEYHERIPCEWISRENKLDYLSISKIDTYAGKYGCPAKFYYCYMSPEHQNEDNGNVFTWFGSILHEVVEHAAEYYRDNGITINPIILYDDAWKSRCLTDLSMYREGRELVLDYFARHPIDKGYDTCVATEIEWRGNFGGGEFGFQADYIGEINPVTAILKDYKTNRQPYTPWDLETSLQLQVYEAIFRKAMAIGGKWTIRGEEVDPELVQRIASYKKWVTGYELFRFGWQQCPERTQDDLDAIESYVSNIYHQILNDNTWSERLNSYCGYCPRHTKCKTFADFVNNPQRYVDTIATDGDDLDMLVRNMELLSSYEKICGDRKKVVSGILQTHINKAMIEGKSVIVDGDKELSLYSQSKSSFRHYDTRNMLVQHGRMDLLNELEGCLSINKTKLDKILTKYPDVALLLTNCQETTYASPYIVKRKYKPKK